MAEAGIRLLRPARKGEPGRAGAHPFKPLRDAYGRDGSAQRPSRPSAKEKHSASAQPWRPVPPADDQHHRRPDAHHPDVFAGDFGVVLFYRGAWCPYCNAQLRAFERSAQALADADIRVAALSVDDRQSTAALVAKLDLTFPVGYGAVAPAIASRTGAFVNPDPVYLAVHRLRARPHG
jgi:thiol-disulfide isomerase/thioredoxin